MEVEVRWAARLRAETAQGARGRAHEIETVVCRLGARELRAQRSHRPKTLTPSEKRDAVTYLRTAHRLTIARACAGVGLSRAAWYRPRIDWAQRDAPVVDALNAAVAKNGRWGFWLCFDWRRNRGHR